MITALLVWLSSILSIGLLQIVVIYIYLWWRGTPNMEGFRQALQPGNTAVTLLSVVAVVLSHIFMLVLMWAVVTRRGRDSFRAAVGWHWSEDLVAWSRRWGVWTCAGISLIMLAFGATLTSIFPGGETDIDKIIGSSDAARILIALTATFSAPVVEELVHRGIMYPAFRRIFGTVGAVLLVSFMFAMIHVYQYRENVAIIIAVSVLSLVLTGVRAYTGRLLPCVLIHMIFNGLQAAVLVAAPYIQNPVSDPGSAPQVTSVTWLVLYSLGDLIKIF